MRYAADGAPILLPDEIDPEGAAVAFALLRSPVVSPRAGGAVLVTLPGRFTDDGMSEAGDELRESARGLVKRPAGDVWLDGQRWLATVEVAHVAEVGWFAQDLARDLVEGKPMLSAVSVCAFYSPAPGEWVGVEMRRETAIR